MAGGGRLRLAVRADGPRLFEIRNAARENVLDMPWEAFASGGQWYLDHDLVWVWEEADRLWGFAVADTRTGWVESLYVDPVAESRGIGLALLRQCCADLRKAGYTEATLRTEPGTRAERFYREDGWVERGDMHENGDIVLMKKL